MKIVATNIGEKKQLIWKGKTVETGIFKYPVNQPIFLDIEKVKEDSISDRKYHGGQLQAVYAYSLKHYNYFKNLYPNTNFDTGFFGENLTIDDLDETKIHQGDTFKVGETILEATLQRNPCYKLGIRFNNMKIVKQFWNTTYCGVYFKVLQTGYVKKGDVLETINKFPLNPTIAELYMAAKKKN